MSARLRRRLAQEINKSWARDGKTASQGGNYFNRGEVRIVKKQFDAKLQQILNKKFGKIAMTEIPVIDTDFAKLRRHLFDYVTTASKKNVAWKLADTHRSKGNKSLIAISYIRGFTKKGTPRVGNIEQLFQQVVKDGIKDYLQTEGLESSNLEYEHGAQRESQFKQPIPGQQDLFNKKEAFGGAQGTNAEQVSFMEVDKYLRGTAAEKITRDKRLLASVDKVVTFGLDKLFGVSTVLSQDRRDSGLRDTLIMQGEIVPVEDRDNPGKLDKEIKRQINLLLKDQATFIKNAVESGAARNEKTALNLFSSSPNPVESLSKLAPKQIIQNMFPHKSNPDMRYRVNKLLLAQGKAANKSGRSRTKSSAKGKGYKSRASAATGAAIASKRGRQAMRTSQNPLALRNLLNELLPQTVAKNMIAPALQFRTGRFASSVRVDNVTQGPRGGNTMIEANYMTDPYSTFAPGGKKYTPQRNPERLIKRSVREIATGIVGARFGVTVN